VAKHDAKGHTTRRTRQHVIAAMELIHVQKAFIDKGHTVDRVGEDYGYDLVANTFDENGYQEDGDIRIQVKATDTIQRFRRRDSYSFEVKVKHYNLWIQAQMPVFLILYDAREKKGYWLYVQAYFVEDPRRGPKKAAKTVTIHVPFGNVFTEDTIDYMWGRKTAILAQLRDTEHHG
jgi:Domain of unknown function (DUF4365)